MTLRVGDGGGIPGGEDRLARRDWFLALVLAVVTFVAYRQPGARLHLG